MHQTHLVGECISIMAFECAKYQVDVIAGDGNKACYYTTPKSPHQNLQVSPHINTAYYNSGLTE